MDLVGARLGALPDAAWLRRQFTADAEVVHDLRHGLRMLLQVAGIFRLGRVHSRAGHRRYGFDRQPARHADVQAAALRGRGPGRDGLAAACGARSAREKTSLPRTSSTGASARDRSRAIAGVIPYSFDYTGGGEPEVFFGAQVTRGSGTRSACVRRSAAGFSPEEHVRGGRRAVIISHALVAAEIRRRSRHRQPRDQPRRRAVDGRRRAAEGVRAAADAAARRSGRVDAEGHPGAREADARQRLVERRRAA